MILGKAIAKWCKDIETPFVSGIPGNGILDIIDNLSKDTNVPFVLTRHEQGASMMAYSYAYQTKKPAVVTGSKAPGATNLAIGVMGAYIESLPMIVITAQVHNRHDKLEAFEEINLERFFESITKWSVQVNNAERTIEILNEAYRRAMTGRPGPVHVSIPYNFMHEQVEYIQPRLPLQEKIYEMNTDSYVVNEVKNTLVDSKNPLILVGGGVPFKTIEDLIYVSEELDIPIVHSWLRKIVPRENEKYIGMAGIGGSPASKQAIQEADVVLILGSRLSEQMTEHYRMTFNEDAKLIHVDIDPGVIGRYYPAFMGVNADLNNFLPLLKNSLSKEKILKSKERDLWCIKLREVHEKYLESLKNYKKTDQPQGRYIVETLRNVLPKNTPLILDSGNYLHWAEQYFPVDHPMFFHYPTSGTMGFGIPGAIGARFAGHEFVCALVGDGGFAMTMSEIETSVRTKNPILIIIINNSTLGHIRIRQEENFNNNIVGVDFGEQDFKHIAKVYGVFGTKVTSIENFEEKLLEAIESVKNGVTAIIDVHVSDEMSRDATNNWW